MLLPVESDAPTSGSPGSRVVIEALEAGVAPPKERKKGCARVKEILRKLVPRVWCNEVMYRNEMQSNIAMFIPG